MRTKKRIPKTRIFAENCEIGDKFTDPYTGETYEIKSFYGEKKFYSDQGYCFDEWVIKIEEDKNYEY